MPQRNGTKSAPIFDVFVPIHIPHMTTSSPGNIHWCFGRELVITFGVGMRSAWNQFMKARLHGHGFCELACHIISVSEQNVWTVKCPGMSSGSPKGGDRGRKLLLRRNACTSIIIEFNIPFSCNKTLQRISAVHMTLLHEASSRQKTCPS